MRFKWVARYPAILRLLALAITLSIGGCAELDVGKEEHGDKDVQTGVEEPKQLPAEPVCGLADRRRWKLFLEWTPDGSQLLFRFQYEPSGCKR